MRRHKSSQVFDVPKIFLPEVDILTKSPIIIDNFLAKNSLYGSLSQDGPKNIWTYALDQSEAYYEYSIWTSQMFPFELNIRINDASIHSTKYDAFHYSHK